MSQVDEACVEVGRDPATLERTVGIHWSATGRPEELPEWMRTRFGPPLTGEHDEIVEVFRAAHRAIVFKDGRVAADIDVADFANVRELSQRTVEAEWS